MNPYASYLDARDPIAIMQSTPEELRLLLADLTPARMEQPTAPGKWSLREILAHLADCELVWAFRLRVALESPGASVTPFDQDVWARHYRAYSAEAGLATFLTVRAWNLALLTTVTEAQKSNLLNHPEMGVFPISELLEFIAGHDRNHIVRLEELLRRS